MDIVLFDLAIIIGTASILALAFLKFRQPIIVAYILSGMILGPFGFNLVKDINFINHTAHIGISMMLFLAGLTLYPKNLGSLFKKAFGITLFSSSVLFIIFFIISAIRDFPIVDMIIISGSLIFSSTILVIKLLPKTTLELKKLGTLCISILIIQDLLALLFLLSINNPHLLTFTNIILMLFKGITLIFSSIILARIVIENLLRWVINYQELFILIAIAWCFLMALISKFFGFSYEVGAFLGGLSLAHSHVASILYRKLSFFRDFFLVLFFFIVGAQTNFSLLKNNLLNSLLFATTIILLKPLIFKISLKLFKITDFNTTQVGIRLGQSSEFSLIIAILAYEYNIISQASSFIIQFTTIITILISSYITIIFYPTPFGFNRQKNLGKDVLSKEKDFSH